MEQRRQRGGNVESPRQVAQHLHSRHGQVGVEELVDDLQHAAALAQHSAQRLELGVLGEAAGNGQHVVLDIDVAGRQADSAGLEARPQQVAHRGDLVGGGGAAGVVAHHVQPDDRVPDQWCHVQGDVVGNASSIASKPSPHCQWTPSANAASGISSISRNMRENRSRCSVRTGAMLSEQFPVTTVVTPCSMDGNAYGSKQQLRIDVGVRIDESGGDDQSGRVDHPAPSVVSERRADADEQAVGDADVAPMPGRTGAVDDGAVANDQIHVVSPV